MARVTSTFKLVYADTAHITPISINGTTNFRGFTVLLGDQCIYVWNAGKPDITFITTYIDNLLIIGQDKVII